MGSIVAVWYLMEGHMTERRDFLKVASLVSLGVLSGSDALSADLTHARKSTGEAKSPHGHSAEELTSKPAHDPDYPNYHLLGKPDREANLLGDALACRA
jgi:hypothetical protein